MRPKSKRNVYLGTACILTALTLAACSDAPSNVDTSVQINGIWNCTSSQYQQGASVEVTTRTNFMGSNPQNGDARSQYTMTMSGQGQMMELQGQITGTWTTSGNQLNETLGSITVDRGYANGASMSPAERQMMANQLRQNLPPRTSSTITNITQSSLDYESNGARVSCRR